MSLLSLALLGGLTGLDSVSFPQAMVSRPIVAGPLAGLILGDPVSGMWAGALLELLSLRQLPVGANRVWDTGPAAVAAASAAVAWAGGPVALLVAAAVGVVVGWAGSWSVHLMRQQNARLVAGAPGTLETPARLTLRHLSATAFDLLRATALTAAALGCVAILATLLDDAPSGPTVAVAGLALLAIASLAVGVDVRMMARGRRAWMTFGAGMALSLVLGLWLG